MIGRVLSPKVGSIPMVNTTDSRAGFLVSVCVCFAFEILNFYYAEF